MRKTLDEDRRGSPGVEECIGDRAGSIGEEGVSLGRMETS